MMKVRIMELMPNQISKKMNPSIILFSCLCIFGWLLLIISKRLSADTMIMLCGLLIAAIMDLLTGYIFNRFIAVFFILGVISILIKSTPSSVGICFLETVTAFIISMLIKLLFKKQIGMGDAYLLTIVAAFSGLIFFFRILFLSFIIAGVTAVLLLITGNVSLKTNLKFVPFVLLGTIFTIIIS
jgi:leader peptidase (prepilin peptidase)/N-methyltransferase